MDVCDELVLGHGMGGAVTAAQSTLQGPLGAAAQVIGRVALRMHAQLEKEIETTTNSGW